MPKCYAVFLPRGVRGRYSTWDACRRAIEGQPSPSYCAFKDAREADEALATCASAALWKQRKAAGAVRVWRAEAFAGQCRHAVAVDAACSGSPGPVEFRGVVISGDSPEIVAAFAMGPFERGTNNVGEFLAIAYGLHWLAQRSLLATGAWAVYSDSAVAMGWARDGECRTKADCGRALRDLVKLAERWLASAEFRAALDAGALKKWQTARWGETPADYDRK